MEKVLWVMLGGALGSGLRFLVYELMVKFSKLPGFWGTITVNILGSFIIGIAFFFFERGDISQNGRLFLMIGLLGGFTTYSSFALENMGFLKGHDFILTSLYILGTNIGAIVAVFGGYYFVKLLTP